MRSKTLVIAKREYAAAVKTKGFIFSIVLMPLMMIGTVVVQRWTQSIVDIDARKTVVIDRTPGASLFASLARAADERNAKVFDPANPQKQIKPKFELTALAPAGSQDSPEADAQRFELSEQVRNDKLFAFIEIGPDVLAASAAEPTTQLMNGTLSRLDPPPVSAGGTSAAGRPELPKASVVQYWSNRPTYTELQQFVQQSLLWPAYQQRLAKRGQIGEPSDLKPLAVTTAGLASKDARGKIIYQNKPDVLVATVLPLGMMLLLLLVVMVGASPLTTNIVEEKQLRIGEVLLGSVNSFELMFGKLVGGVATALTLGAIYIAGALFSATKMGFGDVIQFHMVAWFLVFSIASALMYGALFVAAGAAASNIKEAQALITPVMVFVMTPLILVNSLLQNPDGPIARFGTFFPLTAPLVSMMRIAIPPGVAWWQPAVALVICVLTTIALVWAAGRIFRVGFLLTGKAPSPKELLTWVWKG